MSKLKDIKDAVLQLIFPHVCVGCGSDILSQENILCMRCIASLPETNYELHAANPVEKIFWGRLPLANATAQYYFTKESLVQHLMHQFKYKENRELGLQLGIMMGEQLKQSKRFDDVTALVPLPLFPMKEKKRGYNQATVLCQGIASVLKLPVLDKAVTRPQHTETQTKKGRIERWKNVEGKFLVKNREHLLGHHVLLIDDVITTGATLESCGNELLQIENLKLSVATLCVASH
ncbi:MAG: ComF family protein [Bacteroidetes bacterium]|nr:ComF family protein [Bacteroidota bacterium]